MAGPGKHQRVRRALCVFLTLLALFLVGTVVVLSTVVKYFGVDKRDVITEPEMDLAVRLAESARTSNHLAADPAWPSSLGVASDADGHRAGATARPVDGDAIDLLDDLREDSQSDQLGERGPSSDAHRSTTIERRLDDSNATVPRQRIPKIIHQTWKTDTLPERWEGVRKTCLDMHPD